MPPSSAAISVLSNKVDFSGSTTKSPITIKMIRNIYITNIRAIASKSLRNCEIPNVRLVSMNI